ncbi:MAG: hypothetical protein ACRCZF_20995, partial [Gemmataceae bacterium]
MMRRFKWIEWNLQKIDAHSLSRDEVEAAFDQVLSLDHRSDDSYRMLAVVPNGRQIWIVWRYDSETSEIPDIFGEITNPPIFV